MRRLLAGIFGAALLLAAFGTASAQADPGPNGSNEKGLCTAYFNGQKKGHDKNGNPGPFAALIEDADDSDEEGNPPEDEDNADEANAFSDVFEFCQGLIGGQPEHNGRYDCQTTDENGDVVNRDTDGDGQLECQLNDGEGDTGGDHPSGKDK